MDTSEHSLSQWWEQAQRLLHPPVGPVIAAVSMGVAMLLVFQQVVAGAVAQSELRHRASAAQHESVWRCKSLPNEGDRATCLARVQATQQRPSAQAEDPISE